MTGCTGSTGTVSAVEPQVMFIFFQEKGYGGIGDLFSSVPSVCGARLATHSCLSAEPAYRPVRTVLRCGLLTGSTCLLSKRREGLPGGSAEIQR